MNRNITTLHYIVNREVQLLFLSDCAFFHRLPFPKEESKAYLPVSLSSMAQQTLQVKKRRVRWKFQKALVPESQTMGNHHHHHAKCLQVFHLPVTKYISFSCQKQAHFGLVAQ